MTAQLGPGKQQHTTLLLRCCQFNSLNGQNVLRRSRDTKTRDCCPVIWCRMTHSHQNYLENADIMYEIPCTNTSLLLVHAYNFYMKKIKIYKCQMRVVLLIYSSDAIKTENIQMWNGSSTCALHSCCPKNWPSPINSHT